MFTHSILQRHHLHLQTTQENISQMFVPCSCTGDWSKKIKINTNLQNVATVADSGHSNLDWKKVMIKEKMLRKITLFSRNEKAILWIFFTLMQLIINLWYSVCSWSLSAKKCNLVSLVYPLCSNLAHLLLPKLVISLVHMKNCTVKARRWAVKADTFRENNVLYFYEPTYNCFLFRLNM